MLSKLVQEKAIEDILEVYDNFMEMEEFPVDTSSIISETVPYKYTGEGTGWFDVIEQKLLIKIGDNNSYINFEIKERENEISVTRFSPIQTVVSNGILNINLSRKFNYVKVNEKIFRSSIKWLFELLSEHRKEIKLETISAISNRASQVAKHSSLSGDLPKFKIEIVDQNQEVFYQVTYFLINTKNKRKINILENLYDYMISPEFLSLYSNPDEEELNRIKSGLPIHQFANARKYSKIMPKYVY